MYLNGVVLTLNMHAAVTTAQDLMSLRRNRLTANQIGVVTPYRKQVQKIKALLRKDFPSVQVGNPQPPVANVACRVGCCYCSTGSQCKWSAAGSPVNNVFVHDPCKCGNHSL